MAESTTHGDEDGNPTVAYAKTRIAALRELRRAVERKAWK